MATITQIKPSRLLDGETRHIQGIASAPEDVKLRGESFVARISDQITGRGIEINRTIDGASTLMIPMSDDWGDLRRHRLFQERFELELDGLKFASVAKAKPAAGEFEVTLESSNVTRLRRHKGDDRGGAAKAYREKVTRAEFWVGLVKTLRPEIPVYCPELHVKQPIENDRQAAADEPERDARRGKGLDPQANLTVKGQKASAEQIRNGDTILRVGESVGAPPLAMLAAITAAIGESEIKTGAVNPLSGATGVFQLIPSTSAALNVNPRDVAATARIFYEDGYYHHGGAIKLANQGGYSPGEIASMVEGSDAGGAFYDKYAPEARKWVEAFHGGSLDSLTITETKRYPFTIAANEDWWAAGQRLFSEVNWRLFEAAGLIYVIAETDLLESRVRMRCREGAPGIDEITWDSDTGQRVSELEVRGRARAWAAPPGAVAAVEGEGETIDGNYIVANIQSFLADDDVTVTLKRPSKPLPEPAAQTSTKTISFPSRGGGGDALGDARIVTTLGDPHWGGSADVMQKIVDPVMAEHGIKPGARKETGHTVGGDHDPAVTNAYATDYPTRDGAQPARDVAAALGQADWQPGSYATFSFEVAGVGFRVQILWAVPDHYDHVHVGIRRT